MSRGWTSWSSVLAAVACSLASAHPARAQDCESADKQLFGMNIDPANTAHGNPSPADLQAAGVRWVRIEWKVAAGYGLYDGVIANYRGNGIKVLLLVDYSSCTRAKPSSNADEATWNSYIDAFTSELESIAAHYGDGVDAWEVWNEPDLLHSGQPYDPGVPAAKFGLLLMRAYQVIKRHSTRPVVVGGLASGDPSYLSSAIASVGQLYADGVGVHPYGQRAPDDWPDPHWGFGNLSSFYNTYSQFGKPLWVTEIGTQDLTVQAQYLTNVYILTRDRFLTQVPHVFWFCWSDGMVGDFGLLDTSGSPKPSYDSYRNTAPAWDPNCGSTTDADGDSYSPPEDCDDNDPDIHPGAPEICGNGVDENCDGHDDPCGPGVSFQYDPDPPVATQDATVVVSAHQGYTHVDLSIDGPGQPTIRPGPIDGACVNDQTQWCRWYYHVVFPVSGTYTLTFTADPNGTTYGTDTVDVRGGIVDQDGDGYAPPGDCNDDDSRIHPGAPEICGNGVDENCDGHDDPCHEDRDGDSYEPPYDCDDTNPDVHPFAEEVCGNGVDEDCDGQDPPCDWDAGPGPDVAQMPDGGPPRVDANALPQPSVRGGCGCRAAGNLSTPGVLAVLVFVFVAGRRRRMPSSQS